MGKKSKSPVEAVDDEFMNQLGGGGDDDIPLSVKAKDQSKSTQSDQPIPEAAEKTEMKSDQLKNAPSGREQTDWEKLVNSRSKILKQIQTETTDWPAKQQALESKLKIDEAAIKQQIKNLEADWSKNKVTIAQEVEKNRNQRILAMKDEAEAWLNRQKELKQEVGKRQKEINQQIQALEAHWLRRKAKLEQEVKDYKQQIEEEGKALLQQKGNNNTKKGPHYQVHNTLLHGAIEEVEAKVKKAKQDYENKKAQLANKITQIQEMAEKAEQDYTDRKASLEKKITQIQEMAEKAEQDYQNKKATLEAKIKTVQSQGKENIQQEERAYQESIKKLEKEYEQVNTEIRMVRQNIQNENELEVLEAKRIASEKKGHDPEISEQPSKGVKDVAKRVGRSLKNFAKNTKTKAQELGATIKITIGEAKDNVSEKLEPVKKGVSDLKKVIMTDDQGHPRKWVDKAKNKLPWNRSR